LGYLKGKVCAKNWSAKSIPELKRQKNNCLKEMNVNLVQSIAGSVQKRFDTVQIEKAIEKTFLILKMAYFW